MLEKKNYEKRIDDYMKKSNVAVINDTCLVSITATDIINLLGRAKNNDIILSRCIIYSSEAKDILRMNNVNTLNSLKLNKDINVKAIREKIINGSLKCEDDPIIIARDGTVLDGIKRLTALSNTIGCSIECVLYVNAVKPILISSDEKELMYNFLDKRIIQMVEYILGLYNEEKNIDNVIEYIIHEEGKMKEFCDAIILSNFYPRRKNIIYSTEFLAASYIAFNSNVITLRQIRSVQESISSLDNQIRNGNSFKIKGEYAEYISEFFKHIKFSGRYGDEVRDMVFIDCLFAYYSIVKGHNVNSDIDLNYFNRAYKNKNMKFPMEEAKKAKEEREWFASIKL